MRAWQYLAPCLGAWLSACGSGGSLRILIDEPSGEGLSPMDERVASLTLTVEVEGEPAEMQTRPAGVDTRPNDFGEIHAGAGAHISLRASAESGGLVGYAKASAPVDLASDGVTEVTLRLRRPFAYLAGAAGLKVHDPTRQEGATPFRLLDGEQPLAVATPPGGGEVLVATSDALYLISTGTHEVVAMTLMPLDGIADLAVSPDGHWAVVAQPTGATLVDLEELRAGSEPVTAVPVVIGNVGAVAASASEAYALVGAAGAAEDQECAAPSMIIPLPFATAGTMGAAILVGEHGARDLAVDPRTGELVVAVPCDGVFALQPGDDAGARLLPLDVGRPTTVAVGGGRAWATGHTVDGDIRLKLGWIDLLDDHTETVTLPALEERAVAVPNADATPDTGQSLEIRIGADWLVVYDMAVLPEGEQVALLGRGRYHATQERVCGLLGIPGVCGTVLPDLEITTREYLLVDVGGGFAVQRARTACEVRRIGDSLADLAYDSFECTTEDADRVIDPEPYLPTHLAVLYGDR